MRHKNIRLRPKKDSRAWCEIDLAALRHNISCLKQCVPDGCELMAVVKADAYGLGGVRISRELLKTGVRAFAVATVPEAIELRRGGIPGELLVLGPADTRDAHLLHRYKLTQLLPDAEYAERLDGEGYPLSAHIAADTGMRRLGINAANAESFKPLFALKNIKITGIGTHFAIADSIEPAAVEYTKTQIERFFTLTKKLGGMGYDFGKTHVSASAGILNYPELDCGYARCGIAMYGYLAGNTETKTAPGLRPVVSLKARIVQLREIDKGDSVSYGGTFTAERKTKIAAVSIGYADGVPRQMSSNGGVCLVRGKEAPVIGRICMDLLMLDVSGVEGVSAGDIVTLIGSDGALEIRCEDFAERSGTITNDILCRLGKRLPRVFV